MGKYDFYGAMKKYGRVDFGGVSRQKKPVMTDLTMDNGSGRFDSKKTFGKITENGFKAIQNKTLDSYRPANDEEKKTIAEYRKYMADSTVKNLNVSIVNSGGSTFADVNNIKPKKDTSAQYDKYSNGESTTETKVRQKADEYKKTYNLEHLMEARHFAGYLGQGKPSEGSEYYEEELQNWNDRQTHIKALDTAIDEMLNSYSRAELDDLIHEYESLLNSQSLQPATSNLTIEKKGYQLADLAHLPDTIKKLKEARKKRLKEHPEEEPVHPLVYFGKNVVHGLETAQTGMQNSMEFITGDLAYGIDKSIAKNAARIFPEKKEQFEESIRKSNYHRKVAQENIKYNTTELNEKGAQIESQRPNLPKAVNSTIKNVGQTSGQLPTVLMTAANPTAGTAYMSTEFFGSNYGNALADGANPEEAMGYAIGSTAAEVALEKLLGNKLFGGQTVTGSATDKAIKKIVKNKTAQKVIMGVIEHGGEGVEEVAMAYIEPLVKKLSYSDTYDAPEADEVIESFFAGVVGSATWSGVSAIGNSLSKSSTPSTETTLKAPIAEKPQLIAPVSTEVSAGNSKVDVNASIERIVNGTGTNRDFDLFKPSNAQNRAMFENATGVKLPATNSLTRKFLRNYSENTANNAKTLNVASQHSAENVSNVQNEVVAPKAKTNVDVKNSNPTPTMEVQDAQMYNIATSNLIRKAREKNLDLQTFYAETENVNAYNLTEQDIQTINNAFVKMFGNNVDENTQGNLNILSKIANKYPVNVNSSQQTETMAEGQNESNVPLYDDFKETILEQYPNMPEDAIQEAYKGYYGLTDETGNDIINNNDVYYQRRETNGPQGRYNGNSNEQSGSDFESSDTVRTEGYQFRNGRDYKVRRTGLWQKAYGRVSGTLKKTTPKYIRHGNRAIMFSEYNNARSVKQFFKDVYNRDVIICKDDIVERDFGSKGMPEFNASAAYVQGSILISLGRDSETSFVHEMVHEGQNDVEYETAVNSIKKSMDINALDNHILEKESDYGNTYENRVNFDDDILYETYADIISRLATKEWHEYGSRSELFSDEASYNRAKEIAEDYVVHLINNPPQNKIDTITKDISELGNDFADDYMFEKSESNPYFALKESEAEKALAYMEQNYGEMYRNLIKKYGTIEKGMQPRVNDVDVPVQSGKGQYVSKFARTVAETKVFADAMNGEFEKMVVNGTFSHERVTNKDAEKRATQRLEENGFENAVKEFETLVNSGRVNKDDIAMGQILLNVASQNKDVNMAKKLAVDLSVAATQFGQNVQAFSMLKRMSPDGQLYYLEKSLQKINREILNNYKGEFKGIEIDSKLAENLLNAKSEKEINDAVYAIEKNIGEQIPSTFEDKWNAWRYLAMLGNTRTHFRNIFGNAAFVPAKATKDIIASGIEKVILPKEQRTKSITKTAESKEFAKQDWELMADVVEGNDGKYNIKRGIEEHRKIFETQWLEAVRKFNNKALNIEDGWFLRPAYESAFAQAMTARGLTAEYLSSGTKEATRQLQNIREYAINEAKRATFRDTNAFSEMVSNMRFREGKFADIGNVFVDGVLPFKKTPANILVRGVEYSPIGLMKGLTYDLYQVKKGEMSASTAIDRISAGLTGTAIVGLGAFLAHLGVLVVAPDEDDEVAGYKKMLGAQSYALNFGGNTYTIDWMSPVALPLFVGAEIMNTIKNTEQPSLTAVFDALGRISEPVFELSCLSGIQSALESIKYADGSPIDDLAIDMLSSYITQALPTIGGQVAGTIDNTQRNIYYKDKTSGVPQILQSIINKAMSKVPGLTYFLPEKVDRWGRPQKYGSLPERVLENFVSPGYYSGDKSTWTDKKLMDIYKKTGDNTVLPDVAAKGFKLSGETNYMSAEEYVEYSKVRGQLSYKYTTDFLKNIGTYKVDDDMKVQVINDIYRYANAKAKEEVSDYTLSKEFEKVEEAKKAGISPDKYYLVYNCKSGIEGDKDANGKTIPNSATRKQFAEIKKNVTGVSEKQMLQLLEIMGYSENQIKLYKYNLPI